MRNKLFIIIAFYTIFLCGCDSKDKLEGVHYFFFIFRFCNDADKELIITTPAEDYSDSAGFGIINGIYNFPKRYRNEPYYNREQWLQDPEKYIYDICELATEEKLLALHDNYYTYFPYTCIQEQELCVIRQGKWDSICSVNPLELPILGQANSIYSEVRLFEIKALEKLTRKKRKEMTIDDIEKAVNKVIDEGKLDKYSTKTSTIWRSME